SAVVASAAGCAVVASAAGCAVVASAAGCAVVASAAGCAVVASAVGGALEARADGSAVVASAVGGALGARAGGSAAVACAVGGALGARAGGCASDARAGGGALGARAGGSAAVACAGGARVLNRRVAAVHRSSTGEGELDGSLDDSGQSQFGLDGDVATRHLGIVTMPGQVARLLDQGKLAARRWVVVEHVQRVFAGVEAAFASLDLALVRVGLADLELEATALPVGIKAFVAGDRFGRGRLLLPGSHISSPHWSAAAECAARSAPRTWRNKFRWRACCCAHGWPGR